MKNSSPNYRDQNIPTYYVELSGWSSRDQWNLANVHDPSVMMANDGYFYMYQTDASSRQRPCRGWSLPRSRRSKDLINWEYLGGTMPALPEWVVPKLNEIREGMGLPTANPDVNTFRILGPSVVKVKDDLYRMYYSIVVPGLIDGDNSWGERAFIGMMENTNPANNDGWEDKGYVITNSSDKGLDFHVSPPTGLTATISLMQSTLRYYH